MALRPAYGSPYTSRTYGKTKVPENLGKDDQGRILRHPDTGSYMVKQNDFPTTYHATKEMAQKQIEKNNSNISHTVWQNKRGKEFTQKHTYPAKADIFEKGIIDKGYTIIKSHRNKD